jgi:hypothetical protein
MNFNFYPRKSAFIFCGSLSVLGLLLSLVTPSAHAFQVGLGLQQRYAQTTYEVFSTGSSLIYRGPGYVGELRFSFFNSGSRNQNDYKSGMDFFVHGGYFMGDNTAALTGDSLKNLGIGGGVDFRISRYSLGVQYQNNSTTVTTTQSVLSIGYPTYGVRFGASFPINQAETTVLTFGSVYELGRTPSTSSGSWYATTLSGYVSLGLRLLDFDSRR